MFLFPVLFQSKVSAVHVLFIVQFIYNLFINSNLFPLKFRLNNNIFLYYYSNLCSCFTTEILEGFDVQRTNGLGDTLRKYGFLTRAIIQYYSLLNVEDRQDRPNVCPPFNEFVKRCGDLDKMTISDVFAIQLMQVLSCSPSPFEVF